MSIRATGEPQATRDEIRVLFGYPELAGYILIALPEDGGTPKMAADTNDVGQIINMLGYVIAALGQQLTGQIDVEHGP